MIHGASPCPHRGIHHLLVNGEWALREGKLLDRFPGRPLKHRA